MIAPFQAVAILITQESAAVWAFMFFLGTIYGGQAAVVFAFGWIAFAVGAKNRLRVDEDDLCTAIKAFCCAPCLMGQLTATARKQSEAGVFVGPPVGVPAPPEAPLVAQPVAPPV